MKIYLTILGFLGVLAAIFTGALHFALSDMCRNTVISSTVSPDGNWNAVLFERNCGTTTDYSTQISLLNRDKTLGDETGNLFISEGYPNDYAIRWVSNTSLLISGVKGQIIKQEYGTGGVDVRYE